MLRKSKFKTFLWYSSVGLLVSFAVAVSLFRLYFSSVEEYREQLQAMAGDYLGQPVTIGKMDARVVGITPAVILADISLLHKDSKQVLTRFDAIHISLSPVTSLLQLSPVIELTVDGANLELRRNRDGSFALQGLEIATKEKPETKPPKADSGQALGSWFLMQSRLALRDSNITLHDARSDERFAFNNVEVELHNDGERHRLNGFVHLPKGIGKELRVAADIEGNPLQRKGWSGKLYARTVQLQSRQWLQQLKWRESSLREGVLDVELWSDWQEGMLVSATTRMKASGLTLARGNRQHHFPLLSTDAWLRRLEGGWQLDLDKLRLQHGDAATVPMSLTLQQRGEQLELLADKLQLEPLAALLPFLPQLQSKQRLMISGLAPVGTLDKLRVSRDGEGRFRAQGELDGVAVQPWEKLPGLSGLNAQFAFDGDKGWLRLAGENGALQMQRLFRDSLDLTRLSGQLQLQREVDGWRLFADIAELQNRDLSASLALELMLQKGQAPWLSLQGRFSASDARAVPRYLPAGIMKQKSLYWLDNAFKAGRVPSGSLQFHGYTNQFPFREQQGRFEVLFDAEAVELNYKDEWPNLQQLSGEVHFDGIGMWIGARGAQLYAAQVGPTRVSIDNLKAARLLVDGNVQFPVNDGLRFLRESPLSKNTGKVLDGMSGKGEASLALSLAIPISAKLKESRPLHVRGEVDFARNSVEIIEGVRFEQLEGRFHFTESSFSADKLNAEIFNRPASIVVVSDGEAQPRVVVAARGRAELSTLRETMKLPLLEYMEGESAWQASLTLPRGHGPDGVSLQLSSDLVGVASRLPAPLAKSLESERKMRLDLYLSGERSGEVNLQLDGLLGAAWLQGGETGERRLRRAQLRLGGTSPLSLPRRDMIEVVGTAGKLEWAKWRQVLDKLRDNEAGEQPAPIPIEVSMQQLHLVSTPDDESREESLRAATVPPIRFAVEKFAYDELELGKVSLKLEPQPGRVLFKEVTAVSDVFALNADGAWGEGANSFFNIKLHSPDLGSMMRHFDFASVIQGGKTNITGKLWWAGEPAAVSLAGLNAQLALQISEGTIIDVDPGAGRMLGILSLSALPRRLFLDFSDVFKEGLSFDTIKGDIQIEQGQAYTSNLRMESAPANILITGRTGLVAQDFDQNIYVAPNVSGTATVASALAWGPQVAAVVALLQKVFESDIEAATMTRYHITGSWREPKIRHITEQTEGQTEEQEEPLFIE